MPFQVARALKLGHDGISHAAIDMICALMEPMHENYDLKQEQLNKASLLSSEKFLEGLLDMWTVHVVSPKARSKFQTWLKGVMGNG